MMMPSLIRFLIGGGAGSAELPRRNAGRLDRGIAREPVATEQQTLHRLDVLLQLVNLGLGAGVGNLGHSLSLEL